MQRDTWVQVSTESNQRAGAPVAAGLPSTMCRPHSVGNVRSPSPEIKQDVQSDGEVPEREDTLWSPTCTHMS